MPIITPVDNIEFLQKQAQKLKPQPQHKPRTNPRFTETNEKQQAEEAALVSGGGSDSSVGPQLKSADELLKAMDKTPLFMNSLQPENGENNDMLEALQALVFDGTPQEIALNFKNQGNEWYSNGGPNGLKEALTYYTKGIQQKCDDDSLNSTLYANRAAVQLEKENYRSALNDCASALKLNPENIKAWFRSAKACYCINQLDECVDCCERGLEIDPSNTSFQKLIQDAHTKKKQLEQKKREQAFREKRQLEVDQCLMDAIQERGIRLQLTAAQPKKSRLDGNDSENDDDEEGAGKQVGLPPFYRHITGGDFRVHLDMETNQALLWPVLFLYPEYKETDLIADFHEDQCIGDHIEAMFGPEVPSAVWDLENKYCSSDLVVYFLSSNGDVGARAATENPPKLYKVGREMTLREVLAHPDFVVFDGLPTFSVVVKGSPFNKKFKKMFLEVPTTSIIQ